MKRRSPPRLQIFSLRGLRQLATGCLVWYLVFQLEVSLSVVSLLLPMTFCIPESLSPVNNPPAFGVLPPPVSCRPSVREKGCDDSMRKKVQNNMSGLISRIRIIVCLLS